MVGIANYSINIIRFFIAKSFIEKLYTNCNARLQNLPSDYWRLWILALPSLQSLKLILVSGIRNFRTKLFTQRITNFDEIFFSEVIFISQYPLFFIFWRYVLSLSYKKQNTVIEINAWENVYINFEFWHIHVNARDYTFNISFFYT